MDKSLPHQQSLKDLPFAIVVLRARSNRFEDTRPLMPELLRRTAEFQPGQVYVLIQPEGTAVMKSPSPCLLSVSFCVHLWLNLGGLVALAAAERVTYFFNCPSNSRSTAVICGEAFTSR